MQTESPNAKAKSPKSPRRQLQLQPLVDQQQQHSIKIISPEMNDINELNEIPISSRMQTSIVHNMPPKPIRKQLKTQIKKQSSNTDLVSVMSIRKDDDSRISQRNNPKIQDISDVQANTSMINVSIEERSNIDLSSIAVVDNDNISQNSMNTQDTESPNQTLQYLQSQNFQIQNSIQDNNNTKRHQVIQRGVNAFQRSYVSYNMQTADEPSQVSIIPPAPSTSSIQIQQISSSDSRTQGVNSNSSLERDAMGIQQSQMQTSINNQSNNQNSIYLNNVKTNQIVSLVSETEQMAMGILEQPDSQLVVGSPKQERVKTIGSSK